MGGYRMNATFKFIGGDLGNDSHKIVFGKKTVFRIRNAVSKRMMDEERKDLSIEALNIETSLDKLDKEAQNKILSNLDVQITSDIINGRFFVGDLASKFGEDTVEPGTHKADNPNILIPFITMLALNLEGTKTEQHAKVVCGLPITEYTGDKTRYKEMLQREFTVEFLTPELKGRIVKVIIEDVVVIPEGVAVIMNQMINDDATGFSKPELRQGQRGVIDIGAFTTDIPVIVNGKADSDASDGIEEGIANYLEKIVSVINDKYNVKMTRSQLVEKMEKRDLNISLRGEKVDFKPYIDEQLTLFARKIVGKVDKLWQNHFEIEEFYVVGGGAKAMRIALEEEMQKRKIKLAFIDDAEDPQMQNALGYWKFAKQKFGA
jgi:plasmid segregation protein ParM